jgi:hypothetical protein
MVPGSCYNLSLATKSQEADKIVLSAQNTLTLANNWLIVKQASWKNQVYY